MRNSKSGRSQWSESPSDDRAWRIQVSAPVRKAPGALPLEPEDPRFVRHHKRGNQEKRRKRAPRRCPVRGRPASQDPVVDLLRPSLARTPLTLRGLTLQQVPSWLPCRGIRSRTTGRPRTFFGRGDDGERRPFIIVIVFVAAEKYEISRCLVAVGVDGYDNPSLRLHSLDGPGVGFQNDHSIECWLFVLPQLQRNLGRRRARPVCQVRSVVAGRAVLVGRITNDGTGRCHCRVRVPQDVGRIGASCRGLVSYWCSAARA